MTAVSGVSSVNFKGRSSNTDNPNSRIRNALGFAACGAFGWSGAELYGQYDMLKHPDKYIKKVETARDEFFKALDSKEGKDELRKMCQAVKEDFGKTLKAIKESKTKEFQAGINSYKEFAKEGKFYWPRVGVEAAKGAAILGGIYIAGAIIYDLLSPKNK